ncbi:MAG TPA: hypothetical protein VGI92_03585 [Gemmatimonadales bacterium]|jgi:hypothetical protein
MMRRALCVSLILCLILPPGLSAQLADKLTLGGGLATTKLTTTAGGNTATMSGVTLFGDGQIGKGRFWLAGAYRQGSVKPDVGAGASQDLVEGLLLAQVRALSWLTVGVGPHARALAVPGSTEQWVFIEGRVRGEQEIITGRLSAHVQIHTAFTAHTNIPGGGASGHGGEAGLTLRWARSPIWARLVYVVDRASSTGNRETVEDVALSVGFGRP